LTETLSDERSYSVRVVLGQRDDEIAIAYARAIIELISAGTDLPLVLGLAIKDRSVKSLRCILEVISKNLQL